MDRRRFLSLGAAATGSLLAGCDSFGPKKAGPTLHFVERKNEALERWLLTSGHRNRVSSKARLSGNAFPKYFISDVMPTWDPAVRGVWRLEVSGAVRRPLSLTLEDLSRMPSVTQLVDHFCVEGWTAR